MNERQFDSLDERIRQAAQQFEPPFEEADWLAMESLLDGRKKERIPFLIWWLTDAIMIGLLLFICIKIEFFNNRSQKPTIQKGEIAIQTKKSADATLNNSSSKNVNHSQSSTTYKHFATAGVSKHNESKNLPNILGGSQKEKEELVVLQRSASSIGIENKRAKGSMRKPNGARTQPSSYLAAGNKEKKQPISKATDSNEIDESGMNNIDEIVEKPIIANSNVPIISDTLTKLKNPEKSIQEDASSNVEAINNPPLQTKGKPIFKPFAFASGVYGFERNWVTGGSVGSSERVYGGFLGFQFSKRWGIQTGILKTVKQYTGGDGSYKIPANSYWNKLTRVRAVCSILEIPILLRFNAVVKKNSNIYLSSGFVIHIMEKEEYHYNYQRTNGTSGYAKRFYASDNVHWFSGAYFGLGYERNILKNVLINAEPFIKIPTQGIGQGSVKLYSTGLQLGGKWRFNLPRSKDK